MIAKHRKEIRQVLNRINKAWLNGRPGELREYFHGDMVLVHPGLEGRAEGGETCVQSYKDFTGQARRAITTSTSGAIPPSRPTATRSLKKWVDSFIGRQARTCASSCAKVEGGARCGGR